MRTSGIVVWLCWLIALLAVSATASGLLWPGSGDQFTFTTARGETVEIHGQGLYRYDSLFTGAGNRGTDLVSLFLGVPLLLLAGILYRRGSIRGGLLLLGTLAYFLYVYAGYALGTTAFNELFFLYVALFSMALYAFVLAFMSFHVRSLSAHFSATIPRRGPAIFMFAGGAVTFLIWTALIVPGQLRGQIPGGLDHYTTLTTSALDLGVITPATFITGFLILRRLPLGYLVAFSLLVLEAALLPLIVLQTINQLAVGITFTPDEVVGPIASFAILSLVAAWNLVSILLSVSETPTG